MSTASVPPASRPSAKIGFGGALLLITLVCVGAQVVGETLEPVLQGDELGAGRMVLLGTGAAALLGLVVVNARWLWTVVGSLRFALAIITFWAVTSMLGTLVVQRFPNQNDSGYAKGYISATGDFLYTLSNIGSGFQLRPDADVERWFDEQRRLYGEREAAETIKQWRSAETGRIRQAEVASFTAAHHEAIERSLAVVNALRLPEAFQMSYWFKALLGLLSVALVVVVIQRWRGESRQIGWVMAHFGMVIFIVGASVRAVSKVDGFLPMRVGETTDAWYRNKIGGRELVPLDFQFTLHRFKTEYPRQLLVSFPPSEGAPGGLSKPFRVTRGWDAEFLDGGLIVKVESLVENVDAREVYRESRSTEGPPEPALVASIEADWLVGRQTVAIRDVRSTILPPDNGYRLQYARARDATHAQLLAEIGPWGGPVGMLWTASGVPLGELREGAVLPLPDGAGEARFTQIVPSYERREAPDAAALFPEDPAARVEIWRDGQRQGVVWALDDRMETSEGEGPADGLRFDYDWWNGQAEVHHRLVESPDGSLRHVIFRGGVVAESTPVGPGDEILLGGTGDRLFLERTLDRPVMAIVTGPADTGTMTENDIYYAGLPSALELSLRGPLVAERAGRLADSLAKAEPPEFIGITRPERFDAGEGQLTVTADGQGLRLRLVSDDPTLATFPPPLLAQAGFELPASFAWFTNTRGAPLRFTSDVSLSKDGVPLARALVEPNKPLYLAGYQFSQADFRAEDPGYSGFGVVRDPSVRIAYAGMIILVLGVTLLFYIHPLLAGRRPARSAP